MKIQNTGLRFTLITILAALLLFGCGDDTTNNYHSDDSNGDNADLPPPGIDTDGDGLEDRNEVVGWQIQIDETGIGTGATPNLLTVRTATSDPEKVDTDGDGLDDLEENLILSDPRLVDTDGDGLSDYEEWFQWLTSPVSVDSDGDARGPSANLPPNADLFDGNELNNRGTSPTLADTDGDGKTDYEEYDDPVRSQLIAEIPEVAISFEGDVDVRLNVQYAEALGQETQYGTTMSQSQSASTSRSNSDTLSQSTSFQQSISLSILDLGTESTFGFEYGSTQTTSFTRSSSQTAQQQYSQYRTDSVTRTETAASGVISVGLRATNTGVSTYQLSSLGLTIQQIQVGRDGDSTAASFSTVGTLAPDLGGIVLAPGDTSPLIRLAAEDVNAELIKEFLANPTTLYYETTAFELLSEEGINFDFITEQTFARTAFVEIDFGGGEIERYRIATNVRRDEESNYVGIPLGDVMAQILDIPYTTIENPNEPGQMVLASLNGVSSSLPDTQEIWVVGTSREQPEAVSFDDIVVKAGDSVRMLFLQDADRDGVYDLTETLYGSSDNDPDSDDDGLTDRDEIIDGWEVGPIETAAGGTVSGPFFAFSDPTSADADADGLNDIDERENRSDPSYADTDGDGLTDSFEIANDTRDPREQLALTVAPRLHVGSTNCVLDPGSGLGTSWGAPLCELRVALDDVSARRDTPIKADDVSEIWVARGVYTPTEPTGATGDADRERSFTLYSDIPLRIFGGFIGVEDKRDQRDPNPATNGTVLSGDILGDDDPLEDRYDDNSYHVVRIVSSSPDGGNSDVMADDRPVLDGFKITAGDSTEIVFDEECFGDLGPVGTPCDVDGRGAGMLVMDAGTHLRNLLFESNRAGIGGGGLYVRGGGEQVQTIENCVFTYNEAPDGGALFGESSLDIKGSTFSTNTASRGGAVYLIRRRPPDPPQIPYDPTWTPWEDLTDPIWTVSNTVFTRNQASSSNGGAVSVNELREEVAGNKGRFSMINSGIRQNIAEQVGGGIFVDGADIEINQSIIADNQSNSFVGDPISLDGLGYRAGAGIHVEPEGEGPFAPGELAPGGSVFITNSTIANNTSAAPFNGAGVTFFKRSGFNQLVITNSILTGNNRDNTSGEPPDFPDQVEVYSNRPDSVLVRSTCIEDRSFYADVGNLDAGAPDDVFVDAARGNYRLQSGSICVDGGNPFVDFAPFQPGVQLPPEFDISGELRVVDGNGDGSAIIDMGAHEFQGQ